MLWLTCSHIGRIWIEYSHIATYGMLAGLVRLSFPKLPRAHAIAICLLWTQGVSLSDELLQHLHPKRFFDLRDLTLNANAVLLALLLIEIVWFTYQTGREGLFRHTSASASYEI